MEHGAHLGILGDNPFLILAFIFLLGFLIIARFAALPARGTDLAAEDGLSVEDESSAVRPASSQGVAGSPRRRSESPQ
jgi:hypothetical protein